MNDQQEHHLTQLVEQRTTSVNNNLEGIQNQTIGKNERTSS